MTAGRVGIGIDLGGTNLKIGLVDETGRIVRHHSEALPRTDPDYVIDRMVTIAEDLLQKAAVSRDRIIGAGIGSPGPLSQATGRIIKMANLEGWIDIPLRDRVADRLGVAAELDNDANAAALGEYWVGGGRDYNDLVLLTLGTGIGAGIILGGRILHGHFDNAAEIGHMIVEVDGLPCPCGQRGCLERYASASAVGRRVTEAIAQGAKSSLSESAVSETASAGPRITAEMVVRAATEGDELCGKVFDDACKYLAIACINLQHAVNPELVLFGGGMSKTGPKLIERIEAHLERQRWHLHDDLPKLALAHLGSDAGVVGAAALVWLKDVQEA